jgi:hypothetical protein
MAGFFDKYEGSYGKSTGHYYIIGRVKRIVLGANLKSGQPNPDYNHEKDLGAVYFETLYSNKSGVKGTSSTSRPAYPIHSFVRQYPTIGEIVLIFPGPSSDLNDGTDRQDLWYMPPFGIWNSPNSNVFPNMEEYAKYIKSNQESTSIPQGYTFQENDNIKTLRPFEGDTIIQGRFGQSIRFGSTVSDLKDVNNWSNNSVNGKPITMIVNSQKIPNKVESESPTTIENINRDGSSIYLTSGQEITMVDLNNFPNRSYGNTNSINPQVDQVIIIEQLPIINDFVPPANQDNNSFA